MARRSHGHRGGMDKRRLSTEELVRIAQRDAELREVIKRLSVAKEARPKKTRGRLGPELKIVRVYGSRVELKDPRNGRTSEFHVLAVEAVSEQAAPALPA